MSNFGLDDDAILVNAPLEKVNTQEPAADGAFFTPAVKPTAIVGQGGGTFPDPTLADPATAAPTTPVAPEPVKPQVVSAPVGPKTTETTMKSVEPTKEYIDAQNKLDSAIELEQKAIKQISDIKSKALLEEEKILKKQQDREIERNKQINQIRTQYAAEEETKAKELAGKISDLESMKYEGYWADKSTGQKILGAVSIFLGGIASAFTGKPNTALGIIQKQMDQDYDAFKKKIDTRIKAIENAKATRESKRKAIETQLSLLDAKKVSDETQFQTAVQRVVNKIGSEEAKAKGAQLISQSQQKQAAERAKLQEKLMTETTTKIQEAENRVELDEQGKIKDRPGYNSQTGKPQTPAERKEQAAFETFSASLAAMEQDEDYETAQEVGEIVKRIQRLNAGKEIPLGVGKVGPAIGGLFGIGIEEDIQKMSPQARRYMANMKNYLIERLRKESGAAISVDDVFQVGAAALPDGTDTPESLIVKRNARRKNAEALRTNSGRLTQPMYYEKEGFKAGNLTPKSKTEEILVPLGRIRRQ